MSVSLFERDSRVQCCDQFIDGKLGLLSLDKGVGLAQNAVKFQPHDEVELSDPRGQGGRGAAGIVSGQLMIDSVRKSVFLDKSGKVS